MPRLELIRPQMDEPTVNDMLYKFKRMSVYYTLKMISLNMSMTSLLLMILGDYFEMIPTSYSRKVAKLRCSLFVNYFIDFLKIQLSDPDSSIFSFAQLSYVGEAMDNYDYKIFKNWHKEQKEDVENITQYVNTLFHEHWEEMALSTNDPKHIKELLNTLY